MAETSSIEWTDATWNPITGCTLVSEGCRHCYAARLAATRMREHPSRKGLARLNAAGEAKFTGEVRFNADWLDQPLRWRRPRRIFVCAHGDLFHESVPWNWIGQVFEVMRDAPRHTFQVLTKRPERAREWMERCARGAGVATWLSDWPLPNVWLGTSVEDQATADARIPHLLATPAAERFVSAEPLLGPVDLTGHLWGRAEPCPGCPRDAYCHCGPLPRHMLGEEPDLSWVIVGGESGHGARPMHPAWARSLRDQCQEAGVPFLFKQWGDWKPLCEMTEAELGRCYRSNRPAKLGEDQTALDDRYGRTETVESVVMHRDGGLHDRLGPGAWAANTGAMAMFRIGKKVAGRLLDGRTWDELPAPFSTPVHGR